MSRSHESPGTMIRNLWRRLAPLPGGSWLFSRALGFIVPYTGTIRAHVRELGSGYARVELKERRGVRNHLRSIHAVALVNLGEITTGLAVATLLPASVKGIPVALSIQYLKKARGRLTAECRCVLPEVIEETEHRATTQIKDDHGDAVADFEVRWLLEPREGVRR